MVASPVTPATAKAIIARRVLMAAGVSLESESFCRALYAEHAEQIDTGGVRGGKSTDAASKPVKDIAWHNFLGDREELLYWVIGPDYRGAQQEMKYLATWSRKLGWTVTAENTPNNGSWQLGLLVPPLEAGRKALRVMIETRSAEDTERLASVAPDGILVCEAGACSPDVREKCLERAGEKGAWIVYTGTLENDEQKPVYAWYSDLAQAWADNPTRAHGAYRLPSWENLAIYGSCITQITNNPAFAEFCPDEEHGPKHSGLEHPTMRQARQELPDNVFRRRYGGEPVGLQMQVYPQLDAKMLLLDMPEHMRSPGYRWLAKAGGLDYGTVHPSALVVVTVAADEFDRYADKAAARGVAWVRECWFNDSDRPGDTFALGSARARLSVKYGVRRWGADPNEKYIAQNDASVESVSGSDGSRNYRINLTGSRLDHDTLFYDQRGPGVRDLYQEMARVHRYKTRQGELKLRRDKDDRTAALEDAIELLDGLKPLKLPQTTVRRRYAKGSRPEFVPV